MSRDGYTRAARDAERALLGLLLASPDRLDAVDLVADDFAAGDTRKLYAAMWAAGSADPGAVIPEFAAQQPATSTPQTFVYELVEARGFDLSALVRTIREARRRERLRQAAEALVRATDGERDDLEAAVAAVTDAAAGTDEAARALPADRVAAARVVELGDLAGSPGLATGIYSLDRMGGLPRGELTIPAARPGMGKSAFTTQVADTVARRGDGVFIASLEMSREAITDRIVAQRTGIALHRLQRGRQALRLHEWAMAQEAYAAIPPTLHLYDRSNIRAAQLLAEVRRVHRIHPLALTVVDYIGLLSDPTAKNETRALALGRQAKALLAFAREHRIAMVAVAQLNREVEARQDRRPVLSDLRDSGELEQDAYLVLLLYRPGVYGTTKTGDEAGRCDLIVAKHRNGPTGTLALRFDPPTVRFSDPAAPDATDEAPR